MLKTLFPYQLHLHIFQLEEYNVMKFINWIGTHYFKRSTENKKPIQWTQKAKLLFYLALFLAVGMTCVLTYFYNTYGLILGILFATQSYIFLIVAYWLLLPLEKYKKYKLRSITHKKIKSLPHLNVIGITGSYGKTSAKEFLYHILKTKYTVLRTPESYNTPYGIAKVVDLELDDTYDFFLCEMGAYRRGEIKEICDMVNPKYGILTGINEQHLDSFGSLHNTKLTKFELIDSLPSKGFGVVNTDNALISEHIQHNKKPLILYGFTDKKFSLSNIKTTVTGSHFFLILDGIAYPAKTTLIGKPNLQNILAAATMSYQLGISPEQIITAIDSLQPVPHRLEIKPQQNMILIDNAYNSNVTGFKESIAILQTFPNPKILVTPGIVELGKTTYKIHKDLGQLLDTVDYIFLIGKSQRTDGLYAGMSKKKKAKYVTSLSEVWGKINDLNLKNPVVLLENDLPDNF